MSLGGTLGNAWIKFAQTQLLKTIRRGIYIKLTIQKFCFGLEENEAWETNAEWK